MAVIVVVALLVAVLIVTIIRVRRHQRNLIDQGPRAPGVLLSVLPDRTALVTLDVKSDASSPTVAPLVDEAVQHAFALASVDEVEVRRSDGELLCRLSRPEPRPGTSTDAPDLRPF
jgi:hypothetical protein